MVHSALPVALLVCGLGAASAFVTTNTLPLSFAAARRGAVQRCKAPPLRLPVPVQPRAADHGSQLRGRTCAVGLRMGADVVVEDGDVVGVFYKGTLDDGSVFDENPNGPPLEFEVGGGRVIKGFDEAVRGLKVSESRSVRCEPKDAYGEVDPSNVAEVPKEQMPQPPEGMSLDVGMVLQLSTGQIAVIKEIKEDTVLLDGNHPLAGKTLNFEVTLNYVADRDEVLADKMKEMDTILNNPLFGMLSTEVTKDDKYVEKIKAKLDSAADKRTTLMEIVRTDEWITITAAIMNNPQLQQMMQDPGAMEKIMNGQQQAAEMSAAQAAASSNVAEAVFEEDA
jgi:FKBP-type peptidyl-prolyl cis-trans isomerase 2